MITLVVTYEEKSTTYSFNRPSVIIGSQGSSQTDLVLPDTTLKACHLRLQTTEEGWVVINAASDPFATLNDLPFGKQPLEVGDCLCLNEIEIKVLSFEEKKSLLDKEEPALSQSDIDALLSQVDALGTAPQVIKEHIVTPISPPPSEPNIPTTHSEVHVPKISLKDYYLSEYDDDHTISSVHEMSQRSNTVAKPTNNWFFFLKAVSVFCVALLFCGGLFYVWISNDNEKEEIRASKRVADIAMALTYAQMKNIQPQNQNWSDPEFIKNNLASVLGSEYHSHVDFDRNGQLLNCPYMLRIYTSNHLSQFLIIAQPVASLTHWLTPRAAIVIDSNEMELRKITDLKTLNRLLVNTNSLEGTNAAEITAFIQQGELIPLERLTVNKNDPQHYLPPKALGFMHPDAGNLVYNSPRYYLLGQNLIKQAVAIIDLPADSHEVALFMHELLSLSALPHLILYSIEGLEHATGVQKAMNMLAPEEQFLVGYLQYDADGKTSHPYLLMNSPNNELASSDIPEAVLVEKSLYNSSHDNKGQKPTRDRLTASAEALLTDNEDPIYLHLSGLAAFRQKALKPIHDDLINLLTKQMESPQPNFPAQLLALQNKYLAINTEQQLEMEKHIGNILQENPHLPAVRMIEILQSAKVEPAFKEYLETLKQHTPISSEQKEEIERLIKMIIVSVDWQQLLKTTAQIAKVLQFKHIPDENLLVSYQNSVRSYVTQKLNDFLLSSNPALPIEAFTPANKLVLQHILENAWIIDKDTQEFYLSEFDERANLLKDDS